MAGKRGAGYKRKPAPRVRTGCERCKSSHVKCGEERPFCSRCERLKLGCTYVYQTIETVRRREVTCLRPILPATSHGAVPKLLPQPTSCRLVASEVLYFDFFRQVSINRLAKGTDGPADFWFQVVLRESSRDQCVLDAILAISALHQVERFGSVRNPTHRAEHLANESYARHYYEAIKYYTRALAEFRRRVKDSTTAPRTILVITMLVAAFERLQGNTDAVDRITANGIQLLQSSILRYDQGEEASLLPVVLDDSGMQDAESYLTRRMALYALSSPSYPLGKASILLLKRSRLCRPGPPDPKHRIPDYANVWWRFFTFVLRWFLKVQDAIAAKNLGEYALALKEEQTALIVQLRQWEHSAIKRQNRDCSRNDRIVLLTITLGAKIMLMWASCCLNSTESSWSNHTKLWREVVDVSWSIVELSLLPPTNPLQPEDWSNQYECLLLGVLQVARESRNWQMRSDTFKLCKVLVGTGISWDTQGFVMGTLAVALTEDSYRDEEGNIPIESRFDWTSASWNEKNNDYEVTLTPRCAADGQTTRQIHLVLRPGDLDRFHIGS